MENKQPSRFGNFFKKVMLYGGGIMAITGAIFRWMDMPFIYTFLFSIVGFTLLAYYAIFFITQIPYKPFNNTEIDKKLQPLWSFTAYLLGIGLAIVFMGLLFLLMRWPGAYIQTITGATGVLVSFFVWLYYRKKRKQYEI